MEYDNDITLVTMFYDINRTNWDLSRHKRDSTYYIKSFLYFLDYPYNMVCFIDDNYIESIIEKYKKSKYQNKIFIPINKEWLEENLLGWKQLDVNRIIMNSKKYKEYMNQRLKLIIGNSPEVPLEKLKANLLFPENKYPEYVSIMHCKIDIILYSLLNNLIKTPHTYWIDFGYFKSTYNNEVETFPQNTLDINKLNNDKLTFIIRNKRVYGNYNPVSELIRAPECFTGGFWGGRNDLLQEFQRVYHIAVNNLFNINISDDDQHIFLYCWNLKPELFHLEYIVEEPWPKSLTYYSK